MSLYVVATSIGFPKDITLRAIETLQACDQVIGEEFKVTSKLLRELQITGKVLHSLNEHSHPEDLKELLELCRSHQVALVSDCGTPAFCDPGADLVRLCRDGGIPVHCLPGPSSLMAFISVCGLQLKEFYFRGFLSANRETRGEDLKALKPLRKPVILMDTPYRLTAVLEDLSLHFPENRLILGLDLASPTEELLRGSAKNLLEKVRGQKREFILLLVP